LHKKKKDIFTVNDESDYTHAVMQLFEAAQAQYGDAIESHWFYESENCPACNKQIDTLQLGEKTALSINAYIYRDTNTLIAYILCGRCAKEIIRKSKLSKKIYKDLEQKLKDSYTKFIKQSAS
jgi:ssDNA-binding Zn-finger/Zn-ribbon topoisomerase 1